MLRSGSSRAVMVRALLLSSSVLSPALADDTSDAPAKIEEIVVTATPYSTNPDKLATIVGQVSRDEILRSSGANLADALGNVPGVTGSNFAAGASRPVIRGFDANRVKVTENGVGSFDVSDVGPDHGVPVDPLSTQEIEVIRGAATLRFGSQAIGGVVNAINNRVPLNTPDQPISGEVSASYGTGAHAYQGSALVEGRAGDITFHADGFGRHTNDYDIPGGTQSNSYFRGDGLSFGSAVIGDSSKTGAAIVHYDSKYGIPGETNFIDMSQTKGLFRSIVSVDNGALETVHLDGGYADYSHSEKDPAGVAQATFKDKEWDSRIEALFAANDLFSSAALGVQAQRRKFSALGEGADYLLPTVTKTGAAFAFAELPVSDALKFQVGSRVEHVEITGTPLSNIETKRQFTPFSASGGLVVTPGDDITLGLTLSSAARAPAQTELFSRGPHDGPQAYEIGDVTLRSERSNSLEATFRYAGKGFSFEGAAWGAKFNNFIYGRLTGRTCNEGGVCVLGDTEGLKELFYSQRDSKFRGLEGKAKLTVAESAAGSLAIDVMADYVRATLAGRGNVPRIPPYHVGTGLNWTSAVFDAGVSWKFSGAQYKVSTGETPTAGFSSFDARLGWRPLNGNPGIELSLVGRNLTNAEQRNAVALNKDDVTLPGRDVRLVLRTSF